MYCDGFAQASPHDRPLHAVAPHASEVQLRKPGSTMRLEAYRGARLEQIRHSILHLHPPFAFMA
jgi:hypothetical protein